MSMIIYGLIYVLCLVVLMELVAIIQPNWSKLSGMKQTLNVGLWKSCLISNGQPKCVNIPVEGIDLHTNSLYACRVFAILGVLCVVGAMGCMYFYQQHDYLQMGLLVLGGVCSIIASIIWSVKFLDVENNEGNMIKLNADYSLVLNLVGGICAIIASIILKMSNN